MVKVIIAIYKMSIWRAFICKCQNPGPNRQKGYINCDLYGNITIKSIVANPNYCSLITSGLGILIFTPAV